MGEKLGLQQRGTRPCVLLNETTNKWSKEGMIREEKSDNDGSDHGKTTLSVTIRLIGKIDGIICNSLSVHKF